MSKAKFKVWFLERNRIIAGYTAMVIFSIFLLVAAYYHTDPAEAPPCGTKKSVRNVIQANRRSKTNLCTIENVQQGKKVKCFNVQQKDLPQKIGAVVGDQSKPVALAILEINACHFEDSTLKTKWLEDVNISVDFLLFHDCTFSHIEDEALTQPQLSSMETLKIVNSGINSLRKTWFTNMGSLKAFELNQWESCPSQDFFVEAGALTGMKNLESLQIDKCLSKAEHVINLTSQEEVTMNKLLTVDFSYNALTELKAYSFRSTPKLQKVLFRDNQLSVIAKEAFWNAKLGYISFSNNNLKTLEDGVFANYTPTEHNVGGNLIGFGNPWLCDCSLLWLQKLYVKDDFTFDKSKPLTCDFPEAANFDDGSSFGNCELQTSTTPKITEEITTTTVLPEITTISKEITTTTASEEIPPTTMLEEITTITATSESPGGLIDMQCEDAGKIARLREDIPGKLLDNIEIKTANHSLNFVFKDDDDEVITYLSSSSDLTNLNLLWFNSKDTKETGCISGMRQNSIPLYDMKSGNLYTLCLMENNQSSVSPYSCFGLKVMDKWQWRSWISNYHKVTVISTAAAVVVLASAICGTAVFFLIRQNPNLLKGNKRVIIVGTRNTDAIVMPREYQNPEYVPPSVNPSGYITPNSPDYERVEYRIGRSRSLSENSLSNYINTRVHFDNSRRPRALVDPDAPPLPPFHPSFMRYPDNRGFSIA